ncbi:hypothetical protein FPV67DRAFT_1756091 [Lyophyllum atratum]|nr:hypothetical protein FPV67DRAFT_1756091 [Lyophyllum atratum]
MAKTSKKAPLAASRPISDFFTRKPVMAPTTSAPKLAQSLSSQSGNAQALKALASPLEKNASHSSVSHISIPSATKSTITISDASSPATPHARMYLDAVQIASPSRSAKSQYLMPPAVPFAKRANSPGAGSIGSRDGPRSPGRQRKSVFDSDSDVEKPAPAVYILRSPVRPASVVDAPISASTPLRATENLRHTSPQIRTNPKKKQRLSSPEPCSELVPTSQSDEFEMVPTHSPHRDPGLVKRSVDEWRHSAVSLPALNDVFNDWKDVPASTLESTPPPPDRLSSLSPLPESPMVLDPTTKAAQIIADIKARAYADTLSNRPETPVREFKDELSDSDEEILPDSPTIGRGKSNVSVKQSLGTSRPSGRYSLRNQEHLLSPSAPKEQLASTSTRTRVASTRLPALATKKKAKMKTYNPLDDLLKEKKRDDQRGKGSEALRQAEAALANRDAIMVDVDDDDFTSEAAARKAVLERKRIFSKSSSPVAYEASEKEIVKVAGLPFWQVDGERDDLMEVDEVALPSLTIQSPRPSLSLLQSAIERNDTVQAALLIGSGAIFSFINLAENPAIIPYLCELALSPEETVLCKSAVQTVTHIWNTSILPLPGISFACILRTLARLGALPAVLRMMGWSIPEVKVVPIPEGKRDSVLYRLVMLVTASARSRGLSNEEVPDILMSMILIANEPSSSAELQAEIMLAIDEVCRSIASGCDISASIESAVCTRVLKYVSTVEPVNQAYITALLGSGSGRTRRIARWVAHGIITNKQATNPQRYSDLPPLLVLAAELTRKRSDDTALERGRFEQHEKTDFVDMAFYVQILSLALTNIPGYVMEERTAPRPRASTSQGGAAFDETPEPPLGLIRLAIESLHSGISDLRATHLDRSRTKAALKELSLRIHYQRQAALQSARTLHTYFTKKPNRSAS